MKICLVLISEGWSGAENVVYNLANKLREKMDVTLILNNEIIKYFSTLKGIKIFRISSLYDFRSLITSILLKEIKNERPPASTQLRWNFGPFYFLRARWNFGPFYFLNELLRYLYYQRICKDILQTLIQQEIDIVHLHLENSIKLFLPLFKKLNRPIVFTFHGVRIFDKSRPFEIAMIEKGLKKVDKITCVSKYLVRLLENSGISISNRPITIYNGVDITEIRENSVPKIALEGEFRLLFPGGAKLFKGGDLSIKSLPSIKKEVPNVHLYFAGAVPEKHTLRNLVKERKLEQNVTFLGFLPPQRYYQVLSSTDLLVFPSQDEGLPMVLLESMALGKPVIATKSGGIPEVIKDGQNGILVERNPNDIADAVVTLYKNKDLYEEISQRNIKSVRAFDWNNIADKYIELYETLID